jgi:phosphoribosylformylglycinamidine synthase PurS subunit
VARVVVDVMLKPEILDPQGQAVASALPRLGFAGISAVRQGKRFELEVDGELTPELIDEVRRAAETLLSNPVIEDFVVRVEEGDAEAAHLNGFAAEVAVVEESVPVPFQASAGAAGADEAAAGAPHAAAVSVPGTDGGQTPAETRS